MSRLNQANQLWASLLGRGASNSSRRATARRNAGSLPVTSELLADVTQGMGDAGRRSYLEALLASGGHGGGHGGAPHYGPLTGGTSEIHFQDHGSGETFDQVDMSPADQAELASREAIQSEAIDQELISQFGGILGGEYDRQPEAFAEVYRPSITAFASGMMPTAENDAIITSRRRRESSQRAAVADYLSNNAEGMSEADVADIWSQHYRQFPEFAEGQAPPMTREERIAQKRDEEEMQFRGMMDEFTSANGLPSVPMRRNEKGVLEPIVNVETLISNQRQADAAGEAATIRNANAQLKARVGRAKASVLPKPEFTDPQYATKMAAHEASVAAAAAETQAAYDDFGSVLNGPTSGAGPVAPASPAPADTPQQLPPQAFNNGNEAERAFDAGRLQPGQPFSIGGVLVVFDQNGVPSRVE